IKQSDLRIHGHAVECRIYAEDVDNNFSPSTGKIIHHRLTSGPGIRIDRGIDVQSEVPVFYDPMLSKVIAWGIDREEALARMKRALGEYQISGVITNIPVFNWILKQKTFLDGSFDINFLDNEFLPLVPGKWKDDASRDYEEIAAIFGALIKSNEMKMKLSSNSIDAGNCWRDQNYE
ncbi:MAG: acetyl-CoA carboxylase biotin carboxylase subunit, partial [Melioribacteraceae bacterium]